MDTMIRTRDLQSRVYLFARPSFLTGIARIADPFGTLNTYNTSPSGLLADYRALYSDWATVGDDLRTAIELYKEQVGNNHDR
jgi:hypothetical protein